MHRSDGGSLDSSAASEVGGGGGGGGGGVHRRRVDRTNGIDRRNERPVDGGSFSRRRIHGAFSGSAVSAEDPVHAGTEAAETNPLRSYLSQVLQGRRGTLRQRQAQHQAILAAVGNLSEVFCSI